MQLLDYMKWEMINVNWSTLWKIASDNAITFGIVSETVVNVMNKMFDNIINGELKVQEAYFKEKNLGNIINLAHPWELVNYDYSSIVGDDKQEYYIYAEKGNLLFS